MKKYAILFDMDGVIIDSNPFHKIALKEFCKQHGYELTDEELRLKIYGRTNKDWIPNLFGKLSPELVARYGEEKEAMFRETDKNDIKLVDGLREFLDHLDALGIPRAIATSAPRSNVDFTLQYTNTGKYFETILDEAFVTRGKPDPEIYLKAAAALGFDPRDCVVFEDSLSGVASGKRAACKVVGITTTHTAEELHETDFIINDFKGLEPVALFSRLF